MKRAALWILLGLFFFLVAYDYSALDWVPLLLAVTGSLSIYAGIRTLVPSSHFRRAYSGAGLAGRQFKAIVDTEGIQITGEHTSWRVTWAGITIKAENKRAFLLYANEAATIYMFGKSYLSGEQQEELRTLAGIVAN